MQTLDSYARRGLWALVTSSQRPESVSRALIRAVYYVRSVHWGR